MTILYVLVPMGLVLCLLAVWAFFWAVNAGQFENLDSASVSPLEDDVHQKRSGDGPPPPVPGPSLPGAPRSG